MGLGRTLLLWGSKNNWMSSNVPRYQFVKRAVKKFMPGETISDAIKAAQALAEQNISSTFTHLGENITEISEAEFVTNHYLDLLDRINEKHMNTEISIKLTQIGFDLSFEKTFEYFGKIANKAKEYGNCVFIDIEDSTYVDKTIEFYKEVKKEHGHIGLCLQAYLYRTMNDINEMIHINPWIRLVKGAYNESEKVAFKKKSMVDENYLKIAEYFLTKQKDGFDIRIAYGTHDLVIQKEIIKQAEQIGLEKQKLEFQMLFGIKSKEQANLAEMGYNIRTLISYGEFWFPWYMRRLAERPANVAFVLKNMFG
jgi:proline dehydrogenase